MTAALRGVVALAGLPVEEYALHSLRSAPRAYWGATFLSAGGGAIDVVRREGRWKSNTHKGYVKPHGVDAKAALDMLADADAQPI